MEDARDLLATSTKISQLREGSDIDIDNDSGFRIKWHTKQMGEKVADVYVGIVGENGIVSAVNFNFPAYITLEEFISLLGESDEISVMKQETAETTYVEYVLYYTEEKVLVASNSKDLTGPEITDPLGIVYLIIDLNSNNLPNWATDQIALRQPWLGFEKIDEYLLTNGCELNGLQCLRVKRVVDEEAVSSAEHHFTVEFMNQDGSLFVRGPCCGGNATDFLPES